MKTEQDTHTTDFIFAFCRLMYLHGCRGWQNPISCEDLPAEDVSVAREGSEQRVVPTGVAARMNEVEQRRDFSDTHFPGMAACGSCPDGHGGDAAGHAGPCMLPVWGSGI